MTHRLTAHAVLIAAIAFALSPLASTGFAGFTANQFPIPQSDPPVQPAGYAFSIWGVIYAWLILGAGYGALRAPDNTDWQAMRPALLASLGVGIFWIAAANASPLLASVMILVMAATATAAMLRAGRQNPAWQRRPVALYAGWLTAASGVAVGVLLGGYGVLDAQNAAIASLIAVSLVALHVQSRRPDEWGYPAAVIWALVGVIAANAAPLNLPVLGLALAGIAALVLRGVQSFKKDAP